MLYSHAIRNATVGLYRQSVNIQTNEVKNIRINITCDAKELKVFKQQPILTFLYLEYSWTQHKQIREAA